MNAPRRRSLLEDDDLVTLGRNEASSGDVCERCGFARGKHDENGFREGCDGFDDGLGEPDRQRRSKKSGRR